MVGAQGLLPPDVVVRTAPIVAAISIVAIGGWMLLGEARGASANADGSPTAMAWARPRPAWIWRPRPWAPDVHSEGHEHGTLPTATLTTPSPRRRASTATAGSRHSHLPAQGATISWRSLFALGLAGGLIPSASALLILLGSIAAGRPAFGFVLVVAFGLGMAAVMGGIGLALVLARGRLDRSPPRVGSDAPPRTCPLLASCLVLGFGIYLTIQAASGATVL